MAQKEHLALGQEQHLQQRLSPLQMHHVQLFEMNVPEVEDAVIRELEENPALEASKKQIDVRHQDGYKFAISRYSDNRLCFILAEMGYTLSRRTTAKYRDRLGIPVARLRREI